MMSAPFFRALLLAVLVSFFAALARAEAPALSISQDSGDAPVIVTITGPQSLLDRVAAVAKLRRNCVIEQIFVGESFGIDWGDDSRHGTHVEAPVLGPDGCADWLKHHYSAPGTYQIKAILYHLGPTDMAIVDQELTASVTVPGAPPPLSFTLDGSVGGKTYLFQQGIDVAWTLTAAAPADLLLELVGENGAVVEADTFTGLSYVGEGQHQLWLRSEEYDALIKNGPAQARIRATITSAGQTFVRESSPLTLSGEYVSGLTEYAPTVEVLSSSPRTVIVRHHSFHPTCHGYVIDWADGTPADRLVVEKMPEGCSLDSYWIETTHQYAAAGTYRIKLRTNDHRLNKLPEDSPYYQALTVTVP